MASDWEAVQEIIDRLTFHVGTGELLAGFKFEPLPTKEVEGKSDLPTIRMFAPSLDEEIISNNEIQTQVSLPFVFSSDRSDGVVDHIQKLAILKNAIDTSVAGATSTDMERKARGPVQIRAQVPSVDVMAITTEFQVAFLTPVQSRGDRG